MNCVGVCVNICFKNCVDREMPNWQVKKKIFGPTANLVKSAIGLDLSDHEHEKGNINVTKNCEKSQVTLKIVRLANFRNFRKFC